MDHSLARLKQDLVSPDFWNIGPIILEDDWLHSLLEKIKVEATDQISFRHHVESECAGPSVDKWDTFTLQ